jgi:hypothetical protein
MSHSVLPRSALLSRVLLTWFELTAVGLVGGMLGSIVSGPVQLIVYLLTTLVSVGVLLSNVDAMISTRLDERRV